MEKKNKNEIESLIIRLIENKCSDEEKEEFYKWFLKPGNELFLTELLSSVLRELPEENMGGHPSLDRIYSQILFEIKHRELNDSEKRLLHKKERFGKVRRLILGGISTAAVFFIAFFLGSISNKEDRITDINLTSGNALNEIRAPLGSKSELTLTDGTIILLNAGSSISYRSDYNSLNRDLILEGEAFFKVAKNSNLPLVVSAGNIYIKATGTEFNVKAYVDEDIVETTLINGEVQIFQKVDNENEQVIVLKPNEKAIYSNKSDHLALEKIKKSEPFAVKPIELSSDNILVASKTDVDQVTAWTKNKLIIKSEGLESLCIKLQRKYDVRFVFGDEAVKEFRFSGTLLDETLEQIMDVIKTAAPIDYVIDGKTVIIVPDKNETR